MEHRLYIIEGLPCSGKSTVSSRLASALEDRISENRKKVCFVDEGTGDHPADYEFHAYAPAGLISEKPEIVPLSQYEGEMLEKLLPYKIYDFLPWDTEKPLMLDKWRQFVSEADPDTIYVFNCVFLQNPMCETMMRFNFAESKSLAYIREIAEIITPLDPVIIYLKNDDIANSIEKAAKERPGWLEGVIDYHVNGAYGKSIHAQGLEGYIECLKERQRRELRILDRLTRSKTNEALSATALVLDNPQRDWHAAEAEIDTSLKSI